MLLSEITEGYGQDNKPYQAWIKAVRKHHPNATVSGDEHKAQMVDWMTKNNEVAGDWDGKKGVVYEPGSKGKTIVEVTDKARADAVAAHMASQVMTMRKFIQRVKNSTMSDHDMDAVLDELHTAFGHPRALDTKVTKRHIEDLAAITGVDQDELENLAGLM